MKTQKEQLLEVVRTQGGSSDRIEVSLGLTVQIKEFNYARVDVKYGSDVRPDEDPEDCLERVKAFVEPEIQRAYEDVAAMVANSDKERKNTQTKKTIFGK